MKVAHLLTIQRDFEAIFRITGEKNIKAYLKQYTDLDINQSIRDLSAQWSTNKRDYYTNSGINVFSCVGEPYIEIYEMNNGTWAYNQLANYTIISMSISEEYLVIHIEEK